MLQGIVNSFFSKWTDPTNVRLPFEDPANATKHAYWQRVCVAFLDLGLKLHHFETEGLLRAMKTHGEAQFWLAKCITQYHSKAQSQCNFEVIQNDGEILWWLLKVLPLIIDRALQLPTLVKNPIPLLKKGVNRTITLERSLVCSLLANAFLCTFPSRRDQPNLGTINFWRLFDGSKNEVLNQLKREKIKCFLEYFEQMGRGGSSAAKIPNTKISFERFGLQETDNILWEKSTRNLQEVQVTADGRIEDCEGMLQVDFANCMVGGGVLADGAVQEEIRFCINPELVVVRLFTERLSCPEVLLVTGTRRFSDYEGYSTNFKWKKREVTAAPGKDRHLKVDDKGRELTQIVAMDAVNFGVVRSSRMEQYKREMLDRELRKSFVGFLGGKDKGTIVATGNWGCGAFNGDPQWKMLIQWLAASQNGRRMLFHAKDENQKQEIKRFKEYLEGKQVTVANIYELMVAYGENPDKQAINVFDFIRVILG